MSNDKEKFREVKAISLLLASLREVNGITQNALAKSAGISSATIAKIEATQPVNLPRPQTVKAILDVYKISEQHFHDALIELKSLGLTSENALQVADGLKKKAKTTDDNTISQINTKSLNEFNEFNDATYFEKLVDFAGRIPFINDAVAAYISMRDPKTSLAIKATLASALAYFVLPIDGIPDVTPVLGLTDDMGVIMGAVAVAGSAITSAHRRRANQLLSKMKIDNEATSQD